jgi:hypothetical protein
MSGFDKLAKDKKRKNIFGDSQKVNASDNLSAPEKAPLDTESIEKSGSKKSTRIPTDRTVPFATKVSPDFDKIYRRLMFENSRKKIELLEDMLELYVKVHKSESDD